jgi:hypothetical protein
LCLPCPCLGEKEEEKKGEKKKEKEKEELFCLLHDCTTY